MRRILTGGLAVCGMVILAATHLGRWLPLADSLAVGRLYLLVAAVPVLIALAVQGRWRMWGLTGLAVTGSAILTIAAQTGGGGGMAGDLVLYQKNLLKDGTDPAAILADIRAVSPDFVTLQENAEGNAQVAKGLAQDYPAMVRCTSQGNGGIALFSRFAIDPGFDGCNVGSGILVARVMLPEGGSLWVGAVHLNWPYPFNQARQLPSILDGLARLDGPAVIAGDFNMVPWGSSVARVGQTVGSERIGGYATTYPGFGPLVPLAIDQVLIPQGWHGVVETRPLLGSDHLGLVAHFGH